MWLPSIMRPASANAPALIALANRLTRSFSEIDVAGARSHRRVGDLVHLLDGGLAQRTDDPLCGFARSHSILVGGRCERTALTSVDHDHIEVVRDRDRRHSELVTVDRERGAVDTACRCELVHDPARNA